jgi:hypothetical protein
MKTNINEVPCTAVIILESKCQLRTSAQNGGNEIKLFCYILLTTWWWFLGQWWGEVEEVVMVVVKFNIN